MTWSYDDAYQLTREQRDGTNAYDKTYEYDSVGNRTLLIADGARTTSTYNSANELVTQVDNLGTTTFTFDENSNQLTRTEPTGGLITNTWDYENRRTTVVLPSAARSTASYDPDGLRVHFQDSDGETNFLWDDQALLMEADDLGAIVRTYTLEPTRFGHLISSLSGNTTLFYHFDALGTASRITNSSEQIAQQNIIDAFGVLVDQIGVLQNPYLFIGELGYYYDSQDATYYVRARFYDPLLNRWQSLDPLRFYVELNAFLYTANDPLGKVDASGRDWNPATWGWVRGFAKGCCKACLFPLTHQTDKEEKETNGWGLGSTRNRSQSNAMKHCILSCRSQRNCGAKCARWYWDDAHETDMANPDTLNDLHNNAEGRRCASGQLTTSACGDPCVSCCAKKLQNSMNRRNRGPKNSQGVPQLPPCSRGVHDGLLCWVIQGDPIDDPQGTAPPTVPLPANFPQCPDPPARPKMWM